MKYWNWFLILLFSLFFLKSYIHVPSWYWCFVVFPVFAVVGIYSLWDNNFRASLTPLAIPEKGFDSRIRELKDAEEKVKGFGFVKIDEFYLKTTPLDTLIFVHKHNVEPAFYIVYHYGQRMTYELASKLSYGIILTTNSSVNSGNSPRPAKLLLQIFPGRKYDELYTLHLAAMDYLKRYNFTPEKIQVEELRDFFKQQIREQELHIRKNFFWPLLLIFWIFTKYGRRYALSIEKQYPSGFDRIYIEEKHTA